MIAQYKPNKFLFPATHLGRTLAARTAVLAQTGLTADATELTIHQQDGQLYATRPTYGGKLLATITCKTRPEMCTVRVGYYPVAREQKEHRGEIIQIPFDTQKYMPLAQFLEFFHQAKEPVCCADGNNAKNSFNLSEAEIIVAGGRGVGSKAGFELLHRLAQRLGGEVGATRPAADNGWADAEAQIGITGCTVRPKLYIACGISGQLHHTAGIAGNSVIVAINKDPDAPIMKTANYAIEGDLHEVIPALLDALK
jgi:electron transfer flavoprotein alpha subunit